MTEFLNGGGEDEKKDDDGPLGPIGKSVARRERRRSRDENRYHRLVERGEGPIRSEADLERQNRERNELLTLEERLGKSGRDPYADARAEEACEPEDPVPSWLRTRWEAQAAAAGGAALDLAGQGNNLTTEQGLGPKNLENSI